MRRRTLMETGEHPEGINATSDGQTIVVTNRFDNTLALTHAKTLDVVNTIETCDRSRALGTFVQGGTE